MIFQRNIDLKIQGRMWRLKEWKDTRTTEGRWLHMCVMAVVATVPALETQWADETHYPDQSVGRTVGLGSAENSEQFVLSSIEQHGSYDAEDLLHEWLCLEYVSLLTFEKRKQEQQERLDHLHALPGIMSKMEKAMDAG